MVAKIEEYYGVRVGPVQEIPVDSLKKHKINIPRKVDGERSRVFTAEIKKEGVQQPILVTPEGEVLRGWRRTEASRKAGHKTIPARITEPNLTEEKLRKLIYRDNNLRENYTAEETEEVILQVYGKDRILQVLSRGTHKSPLGLLPLEKEIERDLGIPASTAKNHLATLRKRLKAEEIKDFGRILKEGELNRIKNAASEWKQAKNQLDTAEKKINFLRDKEINPAKKKMRSLETEIRKLGKTGIQQFEKLVKGKK